MEVLQKRTNKRSDWKFLTTLNLLPFQVEKEQEAEEDMKEESDEEEEDDEESGRLRFKTERKDVSVVRLADAASKRRNIPETLGTFTSFSTFHLLFLDRFQQPWNGFSVAPTVASLLMFTLIVAQPFVYFSVCGPQWKKFGHPCARQNVRYTFSLYITKP